MSVSCRDITWTNSALKRINAPVGKTAATHSLAIYNRASFFPVISVATDILKLLELIFAARVMRHWNMFPGEVLDVPTLSMFKGQARWGSEQPGLVEGVSAQGRGDGTENF